MASAAQRPQNLPSRRAADRPPDQVQRDRIEDELQRCLFVEAGAGTGKTERLVARLLALLAAGECTIEQVAAITFTHKAAAELRARFQVALERAVRQTAGQAKVRLSAALAHVEQAFLGTIHSFCARLLRERPVEAGIDIACEEIDEAADRGLRQQAWGLYVADLHARANPILGELHSLGLEINQLAPTFQRFASYPDVQEWPAPAAAMPDLAPVVQALQEYASQMRLLGRLLPRDAGNDKLIPHYRLLPRLVRQADLTQPAQLLRILQYCKPLELCNLVQRNWPGGRNQAQAELARWNQFVVQHALPCLEAWRAVRYPVVLQVLQSARANYDRLRRELELLNFHDLLLRTAGLLRESPEVRRHFRTRFTHLLVDEFQDTDPVQAEVMLLLTTADLTETDWRRCRPVPGALFVVADPKQSIYRFRRADIVTYNQVKEIIRAAGGDVIELWTNFRSRLPLLEWINGTFAQVFPEKATPQMPARRPMESGRTDEVLGRLAGLYVLRAPGDCTEKESISAYEADLLARTIRHALDSNLTVPRTGKELQQGITSRARPGDFLIITWGTKQLDLYARKLQEYRVPHQVTGGSAWDDVPELALLALCLRAITRPDDPIALVAVLRSELFGFSDPVLYALVRQQGRFTYRAPLPDGLEPDVAARYRDAFGRLQRYSRWLVELPPTAAVEKIVADLGLAARAAASPGGNIRAGTLAKALEILRAACVGMPSVTELLAHLDQMMASAEKFNGLPAWPHDVSVVRLMNLHQVKGLEAPVVFLADPSGAWDHPIDLHIDRSDREVRGHLAVHDPEGIQKHQQIVLACPRDWDRLEVAERQFLKAEDQRKLYVAATRAGSQLTISQRSRSRQYDPWQFFGPHLAGCPNLPEPGPMAPLVSLSVVVSGKDSEQASAAIAQRWETAGRPSYFKAGVKELSVTGGLVGGGREDGMEWGTVLHRLLQAAMLNNAADLHRLAARGLQEQELDPGLAPVAVEEVRSVTESEFWQRAQRSPQRLVEVPILTQRPRDVAARKLPLLLSGVIDLAFRETDGWVVIDYKTDAIPPGKVPELVDHYRPQVQMYAQVWQKLVGEPVSETALYFTHLRRYEIVEQDWRV